MSKRRRPVRATRVAFRRNEPLRPIPGGLVRESTTISPEKFPEIERRRALNALLLTHCRSTATPPDLSPQDWALVQRLVRETIATGSHPIARRHAIKLLARGNTPATVNVLSELARTSDDEHIRGDALRSLGESGIAGFISLYIAGLHDRSTQVARASAAALRATVQRLGTDALGTYLAGVRDPRLRAKALDAVRGKVSARPAKRRESRPDSKRAE